MSIRVEKPPSLFYNRSSDSSHIISDMWHTTTVSRELFQVHITQLMPSTDTTDCVNIGHIHGNGQVELLTSAINVDIIL